MSILFDGYQSGKSAVTPVVESLMGYKSYRLYNFDHLASSVHNVTVLLI